MRRRALQPTLDWAEDDPAGLRSNRRAVAETEERAVTAREQSPPALLQPPFGIGTNDVLYSGALTFCRDATPMADVTRILCDIEKGDSAAAEQLLPLVYDELRKLAAVKLAAEKPGQTLTATALVHEAYLRLVGSQPSQGGGQEHPSGGPGPPEAQRWDSRGHFFAAAAEAMRRILVENARRKQRLKHGGRRERVELDSACAVTAEPSLDLLALDEALARLAADDPMKAELVKLRYFAGLTMPQAAQALGISLATAQRHWSFARSWLYAELGGPAD